jgi:2-polyprenyl-6-methoxyphenol hydroxylase-like FAD-dependent oxidoreductase
MTVREELAREVKRQGIEIHWGKTCVSVKKESERRATELFGGEEEAEAEFVVEADGIHSWIRPQFSGPMGVMGGLGEAGNEQR